MKYDAEVGSYAMIYVPNIIKTGSGIQNLIVVDIYTDRQKGDRISLL
jgi:hypothetical protein